MRRLILMLTCCWLATGLAACDTTLRDAAIVAPVDPPGGDPIQEPTDVKYYPSDGPVRLGLEHFNRGSYGIAQRYFKDAVEKSPKDVTAWIGLAASYDRLRRFDLADQAYLQAIRLGGESLRRLIRSIRPTRSSLITLSFSMAAGGSLKGRRIINHKQTSWPSHFD